MDQLNPHPTQASAASAIAPIIERGRAAMAQIADADQARTDELVIALAWSLYRPDRAEALATLAVQDTGLGNVRDKVTKNQRKTFGTLRDLLRAKSVGVIEEDKARGIVKFAKPIGVIGAVTPSTNPSATAVNKAMMALKGRNAIVIAPSPAGAENDDGHCRGHACGTRSHWSAGRPRADPAPPASKEMTQALMEAADLVVITGSQDNVRRGYRSGTPAIGVGAGNVPVIVDETADLDDAARKIAASKSFDNSTSCSSENALVIVDAVYEDACRRARARWWLSAAQRRRLSVSKSSSGRTASSTVTSSLATRRCSPKPFRCRRRPKSARFFVVEETGIGRAYPFSGEKLSLVLTAYRAKNIDDAAADRTRYPRPPGARPFLRHPHEGLLPRPPSC